MGLLPHHIFGRMHDVGCTRLLGAPPFQVSWNKVAAVWGLTLAEAITTYGATLSQLRDLGMSMSRAIQLGLTTDLVAKIGEPSANYREFLGATDAEMQFMFPSQAPVRRQSRKGAFSLHG